MIDSTVISLTILLVSIFAEITVSTQSSQCSPFCVCDTWNGLYRASCIGCHLYSIHTDAPNNVQVLDLSDNVISILNNFDLANEGLIKLKYLNLSKNAISEIGLNAFDSLTDLKVLDLSKNRLRYIPDEVFERNINLQILKLSKNNFGSHVPRLKSYSLTELSLDSCQISHLPPKTFNGLRHIRRLDLSNNVMIQVSTTIVQKLYFLKKLSLEGNPWSCNQNMHNLRAYLEHKNIKFDEICGKKEKKFEKILQLTTEPHDYHHTAIEDVSTKETKSVTKYDMSNILNNRNLSTCEQMVDQMRITNSMNQYLPYLLFCSGFISGISIGLVTSYIWLMKYSYNWRYRQL